MAALTFTALDLAEQREKFVPAVVSLRDPETTVESSVDCVAPAESSVAQTRLKLRQLLSARTFAFRLTLR